MKKIMTIIITIMFSMALMSCGKTTATATKTTVTKATVTKIDATKTNVTKEFSYLPSQKEMTVKSFVKPTKGNFGVATYILKNKKSKDVLVAYEKQLVMDKWKITQDKKATSIIAQKGTHKTIIVPAQIKNDVRLTVVSK